MTVDGWAARLAKPLDPLRTLMVAYFNEDWEEEFSSAWQDAVAAFTRDEPADKVRAAAVEIDELIRSDLDEADLRQLLSDLGSSILPENLGLGSRQWLRQLQAELGRPAS
jgi:hypothetical protein